MSNRWTDVYEARFGKKINATAWEEEIAHVIRGKAPTQDELTSAVRSMADDERAKGERKYAPDANDLISRIIRTRFEATRGQQQETETGCALCVNGWMSFTIEDTETGPVYSLDYPPGLNQTCVPCVCRAGEKRMAAMVNPKPDSNAKPEREAGLRAIQKRVLPMKQDWLAAHHAADLEYARLHPELGPVSGSSLTPNSRAHGEESEIGRVSAATNGRAAE